MGAPTSETDALNRLVADADYQPTHLAAATGAVANRFVASTNMVNGAYAVANSGAMPTAGARHVTVTHTSGGTTDTLGKITVTGKNLAGATISEDIVPLADSTATGLLWFASITSIVGSGWAIAAGNDTITVGCAAGIIAVEGNGVLKAVNVNAAAAGAVTLADANGTIGILKASIAEGHYPYGVAFSGYLSVTAAAATDLTVIAKAV